MQRLLFVNRGIKNKNSSLQLVQLFSISNTLFNHMNFCYYIMQRILFVNKDIKNNNFSHTILHTHIKVVSNGLKKFVFLAMPSIKNLGKM